MFRSNVYGTLQDLLRAFVARHTDKLQMKSYEMQQLEIFFLTSFSQKQQHESVNVWTALMLRQEGKEGKNKT